MVGLLASVDGPVLGLGLAKGLFKLFDAVGFTLPNSGLLFQTRTIVVSLLVGVDRDVAREPASRDPRDAGATDRGSPRGGDASRPDASPASARSASALLDRGVGFAALVYGLFAARLGTTQVLLWMGLGTLLIFFGVALFASRLVRAARRRLAARSARVGGRSPSPCSSGRSVLLPYWLLRYGALGPLARLGEASLQHSSAVRY